MTTNDQKLKNVVKKMLDALELAGNAGASTYKEIAPSVLNSVVSEDNPEQAYRAIRPYYVEEVYELVATARMSPSNGDTLSRVAQTVNAYRELEDAAEALDVIDLGLDDDWGE